MTEHEHNHDAALTNLRERMEEIEADVKGLDPERRNLLLSASLRKAADLVGEVLTATVSDDRATRVDAMSTLALARQVINFAGMTSAVTRGENEDWTRDRDSRVEGVWEKYVDAIRGTAAAVLTESDLPADMVERLKAGTPTEADMATLRAKAAEQAGVDPEDVEFEYMTMDGAAPTTDDDEDSKTAGTADYSGKGLYL